MAEHSAENKRISDTPLFEVGESLVSAKDASKKLNCAPDYVGKLCREGKLECQRIDNAWFVQESSIDAFETSRLSAKNERARSLSEKRKEELAKLREVAAPVPLVVQMQPSLLGAYKHAFGAVAISVALGSSVFTASAALLHSGIIKNVSMQSAAVGQLDSPFFGAQPMQVSISGATSSIAGYIGEIISLWFSEKENQLAENPTPQANTQPSAPVTRPTTPMGPTTIVQQTYPVIERTVERVIATQGVSENLLTDKLQELSNALTSEIYRVATQSAGSVVTTLAPSQRIDRLQNVTITNGTVSGLSGLTDNDIPDSITASNYLPLAGGTLTGTFSGTNATFTNATTTSLGIGSLNGPLQANGGIVSATTSVGTIYGGTGLTSYTTGDILYASSANTLSVLPVGSSGRVLKISGGVPTWGTDVSGGGGAGAWATTTDDLAVYTSDTTDVVLIGTSATSTTGNILEVVGASLFRGSLTTYNALTAPRFVATSTTASTFPYASSTAITVSGTGFFGTASTTNLTISGAAAALLSTNSTGVVQSTTVSAPLSFSGSTLSITQAGAATNGYLSSTDWNVFNNKISSSSLSGASVISYNSSSGVITTTGGTFGSGNYIFPGTLTATGGLTTLSAASSTLLSVFKTAYFGGTATSTFDAAGNLSVAGTLGVTGQTTLVNASSTALTVSALASTSQLVASNSFTFSSLTGFLKATAGVVATAAINLASDVTGTLPVGSGGTGWGTITANTLLLGNGTGAVATTSAGSNGQVLALSGGVPTWVATTTFSTGLSYSNGVVTNTGVTSLTGTANQITVSASTGAVTLSLPSLLALSSASSTKLSANLAWFGQTATSTFATDGALALGSTLTGAGLTSCNGSTQKLLWASGSFSCGTDNTGGSGGSDVNWTFFNGSGLYPSTSTNSVLIGATATTSLAKLEVRGGNAYFENNVGIGTTSPYARLSVVGQVVGEYFTATSSTASVFPYASSTAITVSGQASTSQLIASNSFTFSTVTGFLKATAGAVATAAINLASDITGILPVANGGTGWANINANTLLLGNGTGALATTTAGSNGQVLALVGGVPTWTATTTFSTGLSYSNGVVTNTGVTSLTGTANQITVSASTGAVTLSLPTLLSLTNASSSQLSVFNNAYFGATATSSFNSAGALTLASALAVTSGGTGATTLNDLITLGTHTTGNYLATLSSSGSITVANSGSETAAVTANLNMANANTWSALQSFTNSSTTLLSANSAYFGATATSTFATNGALTLAGTLTLSGGLNGPLHANNGVVAATTSIGVRYGGTGQTTAPTYGQVLLGNSSNGFDLVATSSLGLGSGGSGTVETGTTGQVAYYASGGATVSGTSTITILSNGNVGLGTTSPVAKLAVNGGNIWHAATGSTTLAGTVTTSSNTYASVISGRYAYVANNAQGLRIIDISNPRQPNVVGSLSTGLTTAISVAVAGRYAYVGDQLTGLNIVDVSRPNAPVIVGTYPIAGYPYGVAVSGKYVYASDFNNSYVRVIDVSNPAGPVLVGSFRVDATSAPYGLAISGRYAYVADQGHGDIVIYDISNPAAPARMGAYANGTTPVAVYVSGRYAYVADAAKGVYILDVSNPASPTLTGSFDATGSYYGIEAAGDYVYASNHVGRLMVLDVSTSSSPTVVGSYTTGNASYGVTLAGKYAYFSDDTGGLRIIDINGIYAPSASIGNIQSNTINVSDNLTVGGDIYGGGGLNIGHSGIFSLGTISSYISSTTAANPVSATFMGGNVGIGTTSPYARLSIHGYNGSTNTTLFAVASSTASATTTLFTINNIGQHLAVDGSASLPTYSFSGNTNSGIYNSAGNVIVSSSGTARLTVSSAITASGSLVASNSAGYSLLNGTSISVTTPNIVLNRADVTTGFAAGTQGNINAIVGGVELTRWASSAFGIGTTTPYARLSVAGTSAGTASLFAISTSTASATTTAIAVDSNGNLSVNNGAGVTVSGTASSSAVVASNSFAFGTVSGFLKATAGAVATAAINLASSDVTGTLAIANGGTGATTLNDLITLGTHTTGNYVATLTSSGSITIGNSGSETAAVTANLNMANANSWTALQSFANASSTRLSSNLAWFGQTATSTFTSAGFLGIGTSTPYANLSIAGTAGQSNPLFAIGTSTTAATSTTYFKVGSTGLTSIFGRANEPVFLAEEQGTTPGTTLNGASSVYVQGNYAYVTTFDQDSLVVLDISNPSDPVFLAEERGPVAGTSLDLAHGVFVQGNYAYVAARGRDALAVIDISNPVDPVWIAEERGPTPGTSMDGAVGVFVSGNYAYVANQTRDSLAVIDISNPADPVFVAEERGPTAGTSLDTVQSVHVQGNYAYLANYNRDSLAVIDISNPADPVFVSEERGTTPGTTLDGASHAFVSGKYAYVANADRHSLAIIDISNPADPVFLAEKQDSTLLGGANSIFVQGDYVYVVNNIEDSFVTIDVSSSTNPIFVNGTHGPTKGTSLDGAAYVFVQGNYAYVANQSRDSLAVIDIGGATVSNLAAGTIKTGNLSVDAFAQFAQGISVGGGVVTQGGIYANQGGTFARIGTTTPLASTTLAWGNTATPSALSALTIDAAGNGIADVFSISHLATTSSAAGIGTSMLFNSSTFCSLTNCEGATTTATSTARIASLLTNVGTSTVASALTFSTKNSSAGLTEWARLTSAGNFGLGTTTPWARLSIEATAGVNSFAIGSSTSSYFVVNSAGNVGVGTSSPFAKFSVTNTVSAPQSVIAYDATSLTQLRVDSTGDLLQTMSGGDYYLSNDNFWVCTGGSISTNGCPSGAPTGAGNLVVENKAGIGTSTQAAKLVIETQDATTDLLQVATSTAQNIFRINANGRVGIGTSTPFAKLAVGAGGAIVTTENALTDTGTIAIDWLQGNQQRVTLGGNRTITFSNYTDGQILRLVVCQDSTGSRTLTWPGIVLWTGGTAPTLTTTANKCDIATFIATQATSTLKVFGAAAFSF